MRFSRYIVLITVEKVQSRKLLTGMFPSVQKLIRVRPGKQFLLFSKYFSHETNSVDLGLCCCFCRTIIM